MSSSSAVVTTYELDIPTTPEIEDVRLKITRSDDNSYYEVWYNHGNMQVSAYFRTVAECNLLAEAFRYIADNYVTDTPLKVSNIIAAPVPVVGGDRDPLVDEFSDMYDL